MADKKPDGKFFCVRDLSEETKKKIKMYAAEYGLTMAQAIEQLVAIALQPPVVRWGQPMPTYSAPGIVSSPVPIYDHMDMTNVRVAAGPDEDALKEAEAPYLDNLLRGITKLIEGRLAGKEDHGQLEIKLFQASQQLAELRDDKDE